VFAARWTLSANGEGERSAISAIPEGANTFLETERQSFDVLDLTSGWRDLAPKLIVFHMTTSPPFADKEMTPALPSFHLH
jgi:hypothetical protein